MNGDALRCDQLGQRVRDLLAEAFLHCEAAREQSHESRELRDADDLVAGDVCDMSDSVERQRVVLAETDKGDWPFDDLAGHFESLSCFARECRVQLRVSVVAGG